MLISDWISNVCSADLSPRYHRLAGGHRRRRRGVAAAGGLAGDRPPRRYRPLDARASRRVTRPVAFLFLGETLLIPHLYPIVEALAEAVPDLPIALGVSTSLHEELIGGWIAADRES